MKMKMVRIWRKERWKPRWWWWIVKMRLLDAIAVFLSGSEISVERLWVWIASDSDSDPGSNDSSDSKYWTPFAFSILIQLVSDSSHTTWRRRRHLLLLQSQDVIEVEDIFIFRFQKLKLRLPIYSLSKSSWEYFRKTFEWQMNMLTP
jgi:hypothetical protein